MRYLLAIFMAILLSMSSAYAATITDPVMEKRYESFTHALRCLKCQHQSIAESDAEFSQDVKAWVAQAILDGKSDQEINQMLQDRFGDRIFLDPPWQMNTYVLWFLPVLLSVLGSVCWFCRTKK